ncbi:MAG TPA: hypothetical protein DCY40_06865 [Actinobacteria bacterium]|nr:hypothetical protein [Actinomycetota bacterium]
MSSESGPLLLVDVFSVKGWGGSGSGDYQRICAWLDDHPSVPGYQVDLGTGLALVWELGGAGTADVYRRTAQDLLLIRSWADADLHASEAAGLPPLDSLSRLGGLTVTSGFVLAFWPPAAGHEIDVPSVLADGVQVEVSGVSDAGLIVALSAGRYSAYWDEVFSATTEARRCWLVKEDAPIP